MIKQHWEIDNEEKLRILNLHETATKKLYLINEQQTKPYSIDFGSTFKSGRFDFNPAYTKLVQDNVIKIADHIKNNNLKDFQIEITPGESQVPNQEPFSRVGSLAQKRAEVLSGYLKKTLPNILGYEPKIVVNPPIIGQTTWTSGSDKDDPSYTAEQFVRVDIKLSPKSSTEKPSPYKRGADYGEGIYLNKGVSGYLIGYVKVPSVKTTDVTDPGLQNLSNQPVIFTEIKKDTVPAEVVAQYEVPFEWWNTGRDIPATRNISEKDLEYIRTKTKKLPS